MGYVFSHVLALAAIAAASCAPGVLWDGLILRRLGLGPLRPVAFFSSGIATWVVIAFVLCSLQLLHRGPVLAALVLLASGALVVWLRRERSPRAASTADEPPAWLIIAVPVGTLFLAFFLLALMPRMAQDTEAYHLAIPRLYVDHGGFRRIPFNVYSNWPLATELLYSLVLPFGDFVSATLVHYVFGILVTVTLVLGTRVATGSPWAGWFAAAFFWTNQVAQTEISAAYVELAYTFFFLAAFLLLHRAIESADPRSWLLLAGVSTGMVASIKLNGVIGAACLALLYPYRRRPLASWWRWFIAPAALLAVVWSIKSWVLTGNPIYPFLFGGPEWSARLSAQFAEWQHSIGMGRGAVDYLLLPVRLLLDGAPGYAHFDGVLSPEWFVLVPGAALLGWRHRLVRECLGVSGLYFVLWALSSQQSRFLMPCLALLSVAAGVAVADGVPRHVKNAKQLALPALALATSALLLASSTTMFRDARDWLQIYERNGARLPAEAIPAMFGFIDTLPPDARIVLLRTNRGFFVKRDYIADSFFEASQIVDWLGPDAEAADVFRKLHEAGVTHVLLQDNGTNVPYPPGLFDVVRGHRGTWPVFHDDRSNQWLLALCDSLDCHEATGRAP